MEDTEKRLQFLHTLLEALNITKVDVAKKMGVTPQNLFNYMRKDDMKLSYAQEIVASLGYKLSVRLEKPGDNTQRIISDIEELIGEDGMLRLAFLKVALRKYDISRVEIAEKLNLSADGVARWFRVDDILISYLYQIAEACDMEVVFQMKKAAEAK